MINITYVNELINELLDDEEFKSQLKSNEISYVGKKKVCDALMEFAATLDYNGIIIIREEWESIIPETFDIYSTQEYGEGGKTLPRPRGFAHQCVREAIKNVSSIDLPSDKQLQNGDFNNNNHLGL